MIEYLYKIREGARTHLMGGNIKQHKANKSMFKPRRMGLDGACKRSEQLVHVLGLSD